MLGFPEGAYRGLFLREVPVARKALCLVILGLASGLSAQSEPSDPDVAKGVRQVDEGEYDAAIQTLDTAARRLKLHPDRPRDLAVAYLYLGIAYLAKWENAPGISGSHH